MIEDVFRYTDAEQTQRCPICNRAITRERLTFNKHDLMIQPGGRNRAPQMHEYQCAVRVCSCGLKYAVVSLQTDRMLGYSYQCRSCEAFTGMVDGSGRCLACTLEKKAGVTDARALFEILEESKTSMGISRSEFLSGFLKGVILGVPGLIYEERKD